MIAIIISLAAFFFYLGVLVGFNAFRNHIKQELNGVVKIIKNGERAKKKMIKKFMSEVFKPAGPTSANTARMSKSDKIIFN